MARLTRWFLLLAWLAALIPLLPARASDPPTPPALVAVIFPGVKAAPSVFGVYLGHGLVLTNWHPWTLDGRDVAAETSTFSPSRAVLAYDDDGVTDPGEAMLSRASCDGTWTPLAEAGAACIPYARLSGAGVIFPAAGDTADSEPVPILRLVYASRRYDLALLAVDEQAATDRGASAARLSLAPAADQPVYAVVQPPGQVASRLLAGSPAPGTGPWQVESLSMETGTALPDGTPVFDRASGDLVGLVWRMAPETSGQKTLPQAWITPAARWIHALYAANESIQSGALAAVLDEATFAPVDGPPTLGDPLAPGLGNAGIDVLHYTLTLAFDLDHESLAGTAALNLRATMHGLSSFSLDAYALTIEQVTVNGAEAPFSTSEHKLTIELADPLPYGTAFQAIITYHAAPQPFTSRTMPFFSIGMFFDRGRVSTLNQPDGAHTWFPCNDHPLDRAAYDFHLTVPDPLTAVANGTLVEALPNATPTTTFHWQMPDPMATYLVTVAVADYTALDGTGPQDLPLHHYVYTDRLADGQALFRTVPDALDLLSGYFGRYPFDSYGHVVVPRVGMALETQSMTTLPDSLLGGGEEAAFPLLVHELAHQWYGNTVTVGMWSDIWLNEGFATYAEWLAREARYGAEPALAARTISEAKVAAEARPTPLAAPQAAEMFGYASYEKGAWLLYMLRREIGDDSFFALLRAWHVDFADRPATSVDFWRLAEEISGRDLEEFFRQWLLQGDLPRYTIYWSGGDVLACATGSGSYMLTLPLRFSATDQTHSDLALELSGPETRASFPLSYLPGQLAVDPEQIVLAQVQVQPVAVLPAVCTSG